MAATPNEWDSRHRAASESASPLPEASVIVRELLPLLPTGPALDVACGRGRNTLLLAKRGQTITALDWSPVALEILEKRAHEEGIHAKRRNGGNQVITAAARGIETMCVDVPNAELARDEFSLVLCVNYLERSLFPKMAKALKPGGALLYETFTVEQLAFAEGPKNPAYLLARGELHDAFPELEIIFYRELRAGQGTATLLARRPMK